MIEWNGSISTTPNSNGNITTPLSRTSNGFNTGSQSISNSASTSRSHSFLNRQTYSNVSTPLTNRSTSSLSNRSIVNVDDEDDAAYLEQVEALEANMNDSMSNTPLSKRSMSAPLASLTPIPTASSSFSIGSVIPITPINIELPQVSNCKIVGSEKERSPVVSAQIMEQKRLDAVKKLAERMAIMTGGVTNNNNVITTSPNTVSIISTNDVSSPIGMTVSTNATTTVINNSIYSSASVTTPKSKSTSRLSTAEKQAKKDLKQKQKLEKQQKKAEQQKSGKKPQKKTNKANKENDINSGNESIQSPIQHDDSRRLTGSSFLTQQSPLSMVINFNTTNILQILLFIVSFQYCFLTLVLF